jgi:UDP-N-acetylglucosamine--N-acetylmuramyl-(pentapeptide) pyrophosphoryl-undecaprenol N-acetylglucosamine transferase
VCRSGAGTVCELSAVGLPAVFVPLPIGNGEQRLNAADVVGAGGALVVEDERVDADWVRSAVLPLVRDSERIARMGQAAAAMGQRDADDTLVAMVRRAAGRP